MAFKKLSRVAVVAFALAVLLAVSSLAYTVTIDGTVTGLDEGVDYTAAQYDFANNTYGEFTAITADTKLSAGVWGIKAGDAEPVAIFVQTDKSGKFNFWDTENGKVANAFKGSTLSDSFVPGFWSGVKGTSFSLVTYYDGYPSVCVHLDKKCFLKKAEVAKTVTVEEVAYPLYTIDGAEYYLKEEAYYAVADNALYEGEGEAVAVTTLTWTGATPIIGEANLLAEAEYTYGFTNEQIVPASAVAGFTSGSVAMKVGSVAYKSGYSEKDFGSKVVFYTKTIGSDVVTEYEAETTTAGKFIVTAPDMPADAYVVAIGFRPYDEAPDDIFVNNTTNSEDRGYYHQWMNKSDDNGLTLKDPEFDAPTGVTGGITVIEGLDDSKNYQMAYVYINAKGDGYTLGEWMPVDSDTTGLGGLAVVRFCNEDGTFGSIPSDIFYITGNAQERATLSVLESGKIVAANGDAFIPGVWKGASCGVYEQPTGAYAVLDQTVGGQTDAQNLWLYQHTEAEAEAILKAQEESGYYVGDWIGGKKPDVMQKIIDDFYAAAAEKDAATLAAEEAALLAKIVASMEARNFKYAYENSEIIPVDEINGFDIAFRKRQGAHTFKAKVVVIFKVMDLDGNITEYTWTGAENTYVDGSSGWFMETVDATAVLADADGYVVGLEIHPIGDINEASVVIGDGTKMAAGAISARFIRSQWQAGYYPASYSIYIPEYPKLEGITGGFKEIGGLEDGVRYQYSLFSLNSDGTALQQGEWQELGDDIPVGLMQIRQVMLDGGTTDPSDIICVYGNVNDRLRLCGIDPSTQRIYAKAGTGFVTGYWTGKSACTHETFRTYIVSTTGSGWVLDSHINAVKTAEATLAELKAAETPDADAIAAAEAEVLAKRQVYVTKATNNWLYYGFEADEIIDISELNTFEFITSVRQGIAYNGEYESKAVVYIAKLDGTITSHEYITPAMKDGSTRTLDFTDANAWAPALPDEGYVVGLKIDQWYGKTDPMKWVTPSGTSLNSMPAFEFLPDGYSIDVPQLPPMATPNVYVENGVIKGLDAKVNYLYATADVNGISVYNNLPAGSTEFTPEKEGLYAIMAEGDGTVFGNSSPKVVLIPGNNRGDILHTTEMVGTGGKYNGVTINVLNQKNVGAYADHRKNPSFAEYLWLGMDISPSLSTVYGYDPLFLGGTSCPVHISGLKAAIDKLAELKAAETPDAAAIAAAEAELLAKEAAAIERTKDVWFTYQYGADEIIPMSDFVSMTIKPMARQSGYELAAGKYQTKFVFKVITEDGQLVDRVAYKDNAYGSNVGTQQTYTLSDFAETDGYIVGILVYPYGKASDDIRLKIHSSYPAGNVAADINLNLYTDGYKVVAPAAAPKAEITAAVGGVNVIITNAKDGANYAWSLDNKTWTNAPAGLSTFTAVGAEDVVYVKMLSFGNYLESPVSAFEIPAFKAVPELVLGEGNVLTAEAGLYEIAQYVFGESLIYEPLTEKTLPTGVWAVRAVGDATEGASAPQIFHVAGNDVGSINYTATKGTSFTEGVWTMPYFTTMYRSGTDWETGTAEIHLNGVPYSQSGRRSFALRYQFTADEIIPVEAVTDIYSEALAFYHGYIRDGYTAEDTNGARAVSTYGQTLARVYVVGADVPYYDIYTEIKYTDGYKFEIAEFLADKEGYIVALELYPLWSVYGADNATDLGDSCKTALWLTSITPNAWSGYTFKLKFSNQFVEHELPEGDSLPTSNGWYACLYANGANRYALAIEKVTPAAPTLAIDAKSQNTVTDYVASYKYKYSTDGGETWSDVPGKTFAATKANTEYLVKIVAGSNSYDSEESAITSQPVTVVGSSLVLDGQIGAKVYFDIAEDLVKLNTVTLHATKVNSDYANNAETASYHRIYGYSNIDANSKDWMSKLTYDEAQDLYYIIVSVPAKDADNTTLETELNYYLADGETKVVYAGVGYNFRVTSYIESAKALAAAGNEEFVAAIDLLDALESYLGYADAYFNNKTVDAYKTDATVEVEAASRTNAALEGVEFYGTSLLLEDNVTIRHYFRVNDIDAFVAAGYVTSVDYGTKGDYIYFDITDIPAQELGTLKTLEFKDAEGAVVYAVNYSAANYMAAMLEDDNANLASLANAMYDHYLAAADYAK